MASAIAAEPQRRRTSGPLRQAIAPVTRPATRLPKDQAASSQPATPRRPCSSAKATVVTSAAPNRAPSVRQTRARGSTSRHGIGGPGAVGDDRAPRRRLRTPLGGEGEGARHAADQREAESGHRVPAGGQQRHQHRADDEDHLVEHRLQRERGLLLGGLVEQVRPPGAHARADLGERRRRRARRRRRSTAAASPARPPSIISASPAPNTGDGDRQHPRLAEVVDPPAVQHGEGRLGRARRPPRPCRRGRRSRCAPRPAARCPARPSRWAGGRRARRC